MPDPLTVAAATAWAWDKYGQSLTDKAAGAAKDGWKKFRWKKASADYRAKIKKLYGTMQIMGMAQPVPLDDIFTDAYMLDKPTAFGRYDIEHLEHISHADPSTPPHAERVNGLRLVAEKVRHVLVHEETKKQYIEEKDRNLFILGKPGAGKTTFLKYIAVKAAEHTIDKIPIFVSLKEWADSGLGLVTFIVRHFDICDFPEAQVFVEDLLKSDTAIVLFDGLDEVNQEGGKRDAQTREMNEFLKKYDRVQCLITCRIAANEYTFQPFTYVELADFTEKQIQTFANNWFRKGGERDEETGARFLTEFARDDNRGLRELARTPLLLTLLCLAFDETLSFPQRRVEIYEEALDALLKKWDSSRKIKRDEVYRKLSLGHKEYMLARIAAETFERNKYFIRQSELEGLINSYIKNVPPHDTNEAADGEVILKAIEAQHGIFVERARKVYSFSHLTFQEYFTAKYIVANAGKGALSNLVKAHYLDGRWREVFLLTTSLLPDASQFMKTIRREVDELLLNSESLKDKRLYALLALGGGHRIPVRGELRTIRPSCFYVEKHFPSRSYSLDLAIARDLARDRELYGALAGDPDGARDLGLSQLSEALAKLSPPANEAIAAEWQAFTDNLRVLMLKYRVPFDLWNVTENQEAKLADYFNATALLQDCLELAFMSPEEKKALLDSLYLLPARSGVDNG